MHKKQNNGCRTSGHGSHLNSLQCGYLFVLTALFLLQAETYFLPLTVLNVLTRT